MAQRIIATKHVRLKKWQQRYGNARLLYESYETSFKIIFKFYTIYLNFIQ